MPDVEFMSENERNETIDRGRNHMKRNFFEVQ